MQDIRGLEVSMAGAETIRAIDDFTSRLVRMDVGVEAVMKAAQQHEEVPLLHLYVAALGIFAQTEQGNSAATTRLIKANELARSMNSRETMLTTALQQLLDQQYELAATTLETLTTQWPEDLCAAKFCEFAYYLLGQHHCGQRFREHMNRLAPVHAGDPDYLAMAAFASELCDDFTTAETLGHEALEIEPRNPWAHHALTHAMIRQGKVAQSKAMMEAFMPTLATCGRMVHCHNAWHLGLLYLEDLAFDQATTLLDEHIWNITPDYVGEQIDAISLLCRMELVGCAMDRYWSNIADHIEPRSREMSMPFLNAHFAYALARAGRHEPLDAMLNAVQTRAEANDAEARRVWALSGGKTVQAAAAFGRGDMAGATMLLRDALPTLARIGGSDAQDDMFRQMYLVGLRKTRKTAQAKVYFKKMTINKQRTSLDEALITGVLP